MALSTLRIRVRNPPSSRTEWRNEPRAQFGYVFGLDALRLLAVSIVVVRHFGLLPQLPGGYGVSIFFFLSGFLITRLLLAEERARGHIDLPKFYVRRFIRLLPPLWLMGAVAIPALYLLEPQNFSGVQVSLSFVYLGNITKFGSALFGWKLGYPAFEPLWSLAVEEHFYLLLPLAFVLIARTRTRIRLMGWVIAVALTLRLIVVAVASTPYIADQIDYHFTFTRIDSIAFGVVLSLALDAGLLRVPGSRLLGHLLVWGGGLFMIASMVHWTEVYEIAIKYSVQSVAIGVFFFGVIFAPGYDWLRRLMEQRAIVHLGRISYEIYLWHFPVYSIVGHAVHRTLEHVLIALAVTVLVAEVAFRLTTKRLAPLRRRFGGHPVA